MIREVARREIVTRGRSKTFRITTVVLVVLTVVFVLGAALFGSGGDDTATTYEVAAPPALDDALAAAAPDGVEVDAVRVGDGSDDAAVRAAVEDGDVDVAVVDGTTLLWNDDPDPLLESIVVGAISQVTIDDRAAQLGVDGRAVDELLAPVATDEAFVDPPSDSASARNAVALIGIFVMFFAIQVYGSQIALVVVEEKANRIVEILLALVAPRDLLAGKVIGVGILAALQVLIPVIGLFVALAISDFADVPLSAFAALPLLLVVFVLGFTLYGVLFAFVGSLVSRQEDAQQALLPVFVPIFVGYVLALQAASAPESGLAAVAAVVPLTSPFVLPVVVAQGAASPLLVIGALALLVASTIAVLALAARIYEFTLLRTGSRIPLGEALRLARS